MEHPQCLALIGPSGAGKSHSGRLVAQMLGWQFIDLDQVIQQTSGMTIAEIFEREGESGFRERESLALVQVLDTKPAVLACGGGVVLRQMNRALLRQHCWCIFLTAKTEVLLHRLKADVNQPRPLLADDVHARLITMIAERRPLYASLAQWTVHTDRLTHHQVAQEILRGFWANAPTSAMMILSQQQKLYTLKAGRLNTLPAELAALNTTGTIWIISDEHVGPLYATAMQALLQNQQYRCEIYFIPAHESSKSLTIADDLYTWLLRNGVQRADTIVALGGGVVGDLAGFVAATILRGINLIQIPTTILAMIDSSIGGKTGVNHELGKNLIGAFYPPRLILLDEAVLTTLPRRERAAGWAEAVKHGIIADTQLFNDLERAGASLNDVPAEITSDLLMRSAAVKIGVVNRDEFETGERMLLNYGHTLAHALETIAGYGHYLHGEAVAIGMTFAAQLAVQRKLWMQAEADRQTRLLQSLELPTTLPQDVDLEQLMQVMLRDKKRAKNKIRWILPTKIGRAIIDDDVSEDQVLSVLSEFAASTANRTHSEKAL